MDFCFVSENVFLFWIKKIFSLIRWLSPLNPDAPFFSAQHKLLKMGDASPQRHLCAVVHSAAFRAAANGGTRLAACIHLCLFIWRFLKRRKAGRESCHAH